MVKNVSRVCSGEFMLPAESLLATPGARSWARARRRAESTASLKMNLLTVMLTLAVLAVVQQL